MRGRRRELDAGEAPHAVGAIPASSCRVESDITNVTIFAGGKAMAAKSEVAVDPAAGGQEALGLART